MKGTLLFALSVQATTVDRIVFVDGIKRLTLVTIRLIFIIDLFILQSLLFR